MRVSRWKRIIASFLMAAGFYGFRDVPGTWDWIWLAIAQLGILTLVDGSEQE